MKVESGYNIDWFHIKLTHIQPQHDLHCPMGGQYPSNCHFINICVDHLNVLVSVPDFISLCHDDIYVGPVISVCEMTGFCCGKKQTMHHTSISDVEYNAQC